MKGLSKSRYTAFCQCPKNLWLKVFKPEEAKVDEALQARFAEGNKVGDLAMGLFGDYKEAKAKKPDGSLDLAAMASQTRQYMEEGVENICEASFTLDNHYCAVDILRRNGDGWDIYEVKSSTYKGDEHDTPKGLLVYSRDVAYQKWLLTQCGVKVNGCYLVRLNKFYTRGKDLDIQQLFHIKNMDEMVENEYVKVQANVSLAQKTLVGDEPNEPVAEHCQKPCRNHRGRQQDGHHVRSVPTTMGEELFRVVSSVPRRGEDIRHQGEGLRCLPTRLRQQEGACHV